ETRQVRAGRGGAHQPFYNCISITRDECAQMRVVSNSSAWGEHSPIDIDRQGDVRIDHEPEYAPAFHIPVISARNADSNRSANPALGESATGAVQVPKYSPDRPETVARQEPFNDCADLREDRPPTLPAAAGFVISNRDRGDGSATYSAMARISRFSKTRLSAFAVSRTATSTMARAKSSARITWLGNNTRSAG